MRRKSDRASSLWSRLSREVYQWLQTRKITQPRGPFCQFLLRLVKKAGKQSLTCTKSQFAVLEIDATPSNSDGFMTRVGDTQCVKGVECLCSRDTQWSCLPFWLGFYGVNVTGGMAINYQNLLSHEAILLKLMSLLETFLKKLTPKQETKK